MKLLANRRNERSQLAAIRTALQNRGYLREDAATGERIRSFLREQPRRGKRRLLLYLLYWHFEGFKLCIWTKAHPGQLFEFRADGLRLTALDKNEEHMLAQLLEETPKRRGPASWPVQGQELIKYRDHWEQNSGKREAP